MVVTTLAEANATVPCQLLVKAEVTLTTEPTTYMEYDDTEKHWKCVKSVTARDAQNNDEFVLELCPGETFIAKGQTYTEETTGATRLSFRLEDVQGAMNVIVWKPSPELTVVVSSDVCRTVVFLRIDLQLVATEDEFLALVTDCVKKTCPPGANFKEGEPLKYTIMDHRRVGEEEEEE